MEDEEANKKFQKQLDKWHSYKRGEWRWNDRPMHRDLTIDLIRGGDAMGKLIKNDLSALNAADDCMTAMNDFVANGGHHNEQDRSMPLPVSPGACLKMKRKVQEKFQKKVPVPESEENPSSPVTSNVEFLGEDVFLTSAPYVDDEENNNDENNHENNTVVIDHESDGGNHSNNMLLAVKRHNNFRLRKKELLKQQLTTPSRTMDTTSDEIADSLSELVRDKTSSSPPVMPLTSSSLAVSQSETPRSPLAELVRASSHRQSICQQPIITHDPSSSSKSRHVDTPDYKSSSSNLPQSEVPPSMYDEQRRQRRDHRRTSGSGDGDDTAARATESYAEDLLRDAEMRMHALEYCQDDDEGLISQRTRQQYRLAQEVEHDLQTYDRKIPDIKAAQHSWQYAKKAHALASERQALLEAARVARLEADRLAKVEAKASAQLEALKKFVELKETKLKKARKIRSTRRRSEDNGGEEMDESCVKPQDGEDATVEVLPKKILARSKSAYTHKKGEMAEGGGPNGQRPTWLSSSGTANDDSRVEYQGVGNKTTTNATNSSSSNNNTHTKPELGCGEKWLAAVLAERKAAAAAAAVSTTQTAPIDTKEPKISQQPVLSRRQSIENAKEREKEKERMIMMQGEKKGKKGLKKKHPMPSSAADFGLLDDDELELRLAGDYVAKAGVGMTDGSMRPNYLQSALSLLSNPATSSYPGAAAAAAAVAAATPAPLSLCQSGLMVPGPPSHFLRHDDTQKNHYHHSVPSSSDAVMPPSVHVPAATTKGFRGMGSIDSPGDGAAYFPHFPRGTAAPAGPPSSIYRPQQTPTPSSFQLIKEESSSHHQSFNNVMQLVDDALLLQPTSLAAPPSIPPPPSSSQISPSPVYPTNNKSSTVPPSTTVSIEVVDFFDPISSTADKGRLRLQDPRQFEADSIRCVPDAEKNGVTLVLGRKRCRFNPLDKITTPVVAGEGTGTGENDGGRQQEVVAVLFDRHVFISEIDASVWWKQNQHRVTTTTSIITSRI